MLEIKEIKPQQQINVCQIHNNLLVETCSLHITLCNKNICADVQIGQYHATKHRMHIRNRALFAT